MKSMWKLVSSSWQTQGILSNKQDYHSQQGRIEDKARKTVPSQSQWGLTWTGKCQGKVAGPSAPPVWSHLFTKMSRNNFFSRRSTIYDLWWFCCTHRFVWLTNRGIAILQVLVRHVNFNPWTRGKNWHLDVLQNLDDACTVGAALHSICLSKQVGCGNYIVHVKLLQKEKRSAHLWTGLCLQGKYW